MLGFTMAIISNFTGEPQTRVNITYITLMEVNDITFTTDVGD